MEAAIRNRCSHQYLVSSRLTASAIVCFHNDEFVYSMLCYSVRPH